MELVELSTQAGSYKFAYNAVRRFGLQEQFPDSKRLYNLSTVHKLAGALGALPPGLGRRAPRRAAAWLAELTLSPPFRPGPQSKGIAPQWAENARIARSARRGRGVARCGALVLL